ncbi:MAG: hydroxyacid dehydrogenase, partial [Phycisphaerae bacterium]|nr:hydroxyacid dehydrogenase [Phycisphaerae bacterium]
AIKAKNLRVGLDVYENEPSAGAPDFDQTELAELTSCTPHIGASTDQASEATAEEVIRVIKTYKDTGKPVNTVNIRAASSAVTNLVIRHYNHVGVLAGVLDELRNEGVNIEEMENTIFDGGQTASCTLRLDSEPSPKTIEKISGEKNIIQVMLK